MRCHHSHLLRSPPSAGWPTYARYSNSVGFNAHWIIGYSEWGHDWGRRRVVELVAAAQRSGQKVLRTWAFNTKLPRTPAGTYDEDQFEVKTLGTWY